MFVSTRSRYALRALLCMALHDQDDQPVSIRFIAEKEKITPDYLVQLFQQLKKSGIIRSIRGPKGGYLLTRPPDQIYVYDIFDAFQEDLLQDFCQINYYSCEMKDGCIAKPFWVEVRNLIKDYTKNITVQDILDKYGGTNES